MDFQDVVRRRRMVRNFEARPVPPEVLDRVLANAVRAPSAGHTQGSEFVVLEGPAQTETFWSATWGGRDRGRFRWPGLFRAPVIVVPLANRQAYVERYSEPDKAGSGLDRPDAWPVPYWQVDCAFATLLMLLTAVDAGLGALFFGIFRGERELLDALGVPGGYRPIGAVAVGYPAPDEPSPSLGRGRRPLGEVVHRGRW
jgi:nitroreductase